jgi:hypothetical protein
MITLIITFLLIVNLFYTSGKEEKKERPLRGENLSGIDNKRQTPQLKEDVNRTDKL